MFTFYSNQLILESTLIGHISTDLLLYSEKLMDFLETIHDKGIQQSLRFYVKMYRMIY